MVRSAFTWPKKPMNKNISLLQTEYERPIRMLRVVFSTFILRILTLLLMSSFVLQPIARAYASEEVVTTPIPAAVLDVPAEVTEQPRDTILLEVPAPSTTAPVSSPVVPSNEPEILVSTTTDTIASSTDPVVLLPPKNETGLNENPDDFSTTLHDVVTAEVDEDVEEELTEEDTTASSTIDTSVAVLTVHSDSLVQFDKSDCVAVADGSFYCQPKKTEPLKAEDGLFSYPDSDGDLEIFFQRNSELNQITYNTVDDGAPSYDSVSNTIVWHRQISERYQIMSYDVASAVETQLTSDTVNNMEPTRVGQYTAWQRWSGDNWDIVLFDGKQTTILTTTLEHDIAPHIRGSLVVWNRISRDQAQTIEIYNIQTGEYTTIQDSEGGVISNPRMVLVYESSFENGDVVTKGYDMMTGEISDLAATPASVPDEIPPPDDTGETRALIQGKLPTKEDLEQSSSTTPKIGSNPEPEPDPMIESVSSTTLVVASSSVPATITPEETTSTSTADMTLDMVVVPANTEAEFNLVIPPFSATSTEYQ